MAPNLKINPKYEIVENVIDIKDEPEDLKPTEWNIYRVPCNLRKLNTDAYTPQLVSIGPLHFGHKKLKPMQKQKLRYLDHFWGRVKNNTEAIDGFKKFLDDNEEDIRLCYAVKLCEKKKLVDMMLLDSVFIMELFLRIQKQNLEEEKKRSRDNKIGGHDAPKQTDSDDDIILKQSWLKKSIQRDLLLLENQIPLSILKKLYDTVDADSDPVKKEHPTFIELAYHYFDCYDTYKKADSSSSNQAIARSDLNREPAKYNNISVPGFMKKSSSRLRQLKQKWGKNEPTHFTDLIRSFYICKGGPSKNDTGSENKSSSGFIQLMKNCGTHKKSDCSSGEETGSSDSNDEHSKNEPKHFTDLIRSFYVCKGLTHCKKESPLRTATKLREAGVSFEKVVNKPLLEIKFERVPILSWFLCFGCLPKFSYFEARLQIPELKVIDTTECVLRNLIAFEQCHYPNQPYICNYVSFIDSLIHTKDDVELLVEKEVIVHELGSDKEVATLVNGLCKHVVADKTCYADLIIKLNTHYQRQWNRTMAALRLVYFKDAWRASSTVVATAVLVFTIFNFCRVVKLVLDLEGGTKP